MKESSSSSIGLSSDYMLVEIPDLVVLVSDMLVQLIMHNDALPLDQAALTRFHSRSPPAISVQDYLHRITRYSSLERSSLLAVIFYIDLFSSAYPQFTISSLTVHRFLITGATVASKGLCDAFCTNTHYAKIGGISTCELNMLELELLTRIGWRIVPPPQVLNEYFSRLVERHHIYSFE